MTQTTQTTMRAAAIDQFGGIGPLRCTRFPFPRSGRTKC